MSFTEKPHGNAIGEGIVNAGLYLFEPEILHSFPTDRPLSLEKQVFPTLAIQGSLAGCILSGYFADIGTPEELEKLERDMLTGKVTLPRLK